MLCVVCAIYVCIDAIIVHLLSLCLFEVGDADITSLFGLRAADRDRAMKLFRGGNIVSDSVQLTTGTTRGSSQERVWVISGDVVASQRTRVYQARVVFSQVLQHTCAPTHNACKSSDCHTHTLSTHTIICPLYTYSHTHTEHGSCLRQTSRIL